MIQYLIALTIAQLCRGKEILLLLTQDLEYTEITEDILIKKDFKIVRTHSAGGFAEINKDLIIILPFTAALVKQIITDLIWPLLIISTGFEVFNNNK